MKKINKLMRALLLTLVATLAIGFQSCNSYLDVDEYIDQMTSLDSVFSRKALLVKYVNGAAHFSPNEGNIWTNSPTPFQMASDENFASWNDDRHAGMKFLLDEITPYSWYYNNYPGYYRYRTSRVDGTLLLLGGILLLSIDVTIWSCTYCT